MVEFGIKSEDVVLNDGGGVALVYGSVIEVVVNFWLLAVNVGDRFWGEGDAEVIEVDLQFQVLQRGVLIGRS